jgi:hypothetical protein
MLFYIRTGTAVVEKEFEDESKGKEHVRDSSQDFGMAHRSLGRE